MQKYIPIIATLALSACGGGGSGGNATPAAPTAVQSFVTANSGSFLSCVANANSALGFGAVFVSNGTGRWVGVVSGAVTPSTAMTWTTTSPTTLTFDVPGIGTFVLSIVSNSQISALEGTVPFSCALEAGTLTTASFLRSISR